MLKNDQIVKYLLREINPEHRTISTQSIDTNVIVMFISITLQLDRLVFTLAFVCLYLELYKFLALKSSIYTDFRHILRSVTKLAGS